MQSALRFIGFCAVIALATLLAMVVKDIIQNWGHTVARALAIGFILGSALFHIAHRIRYGFWFEVSDEPQVGRQNNRQQ